MTTLTKTDEAIFRLFNEIEAEIQILSSKYEGGQDAEDYTGTEYNN